MPYTNDSIISQRMKASDLTRRWKRKVHRLRAIVAGVPGAFDSYAGQKDQSSEAYREGTDEFHDYLVLDFPEGQSNRILKALKILVQRIAYKYPESEFTDLREANEAPLAMLNSEYVRIRGEECNITEQMELALWDAIIGGLGWTFAGLREGKPVVEYADVLDVNWDVHARFVKEARWQTRRCRGPLWRQIEIYGKKAFPNILTKNENEEQPVSVVEYYDIEGDAGSYCTLVQTDGQDVQDIVNKSALPYPDLPGTAITFFTIPSVRIPLGIVEMILPNQKAVMEAEETIREVTKRMKNLYLVKKGSMDAESFESFGEGDVGAAIEVTDPEGVKLLQPGEVASSVMAWFQQNDQEIIEHAGVNPYATGGRVEGVSYAAEVNAIQGNADLTTAWVSKAHSEFWQKTLSKFLKVGAMYDTTPITIQLANDTLEFDVTDPINVYLKPDSQLVVREDTMMYKPRDQVVQESVVNLQVAAQYAQFFPSNLAREYEDWLKARGVKDIARRMAPPAMPMMPATSAQPGGGIEANQ